MTRNKANKYQPKRGCWISQKNVDRIGYLIDKYKIKTPHKLLEYAKSKKSSIHHLFEWDDGKAAHQYRLWQARHYFLSIELVTNNGGVKALHSIRIVPNERNYESRRIVINSNPKLRDRSDELYQLIKAHCDTAIGLGLDKICDQWAEIVNTVYGNPPTLTKFGQTG